MEINTEMRTAPGQAEQRLSASRQGRWLYELEQALMLRTVHKDGGAGRSQDAMPEEQPAAPQLAEAARGNGAAAAPSPDKDATRAAAPQSRQPAQSLAAFAANIDSAANSSAVLWPS